MSNQTDIFPLFAHFVPPNNLTNLRFYLIIVLKGVLNMNNLIKTELGNKEIFSRNLKRYIEKSGRSQREIAEEIGVGQSTFTDWVKGRIYPRMDKVEKLANYFGIKKSDLVEDVNFGKSEISDKEQEILDLFHKVPDEKKEFLLKMIQAAIDTL